MATPSGGKDTPIPKRLSDRIAGAFGGAWNGWFGPDAPLTPIAPKEEVEGRRWDYPYGVNLSYAPRAEQGSAAVPFEVLRAIADPAQGGLDLLRLAISKRKRQMQTLKWQITGREDGDDGGPRAEEIEAFFRRPDGFRTFRQWLGMLLEDHFVIDAVTVYPRAHPDGQPRLDPVDGATIKVIIDEFGRTPFPPFPAYQQFLKGVPAVDYTIDELRYYSSDQRTDHLYGYSRVEQVIGIVSIALNRQLSIGTYYTKGSIPEMLLEMPETLSSSTQLKEFDEFWQSILSGDIANRWRARMIPAGAKAVFAKDAILKDMFDEWLARIICFAFDLPPTALVKETNRATADTAHETSEEEGLESTKADVKGWLDDMIEHDFGAPDLVFEWEEKGVVDQKVNAEIIQIYLGGGGKKAIITLDEARKKAGYPDLTEAQRTELDEVNAPPPVMNPDGTPADGGPDGQGGPPGAPKTPSAFPQANKVRRLRAGRSLSRPPRDDAEHAHLVDRLREIIAARLHSIAVSAAGVLRHSLREVDTLAHGKPEHAAKANTDDLARILASLGPEEWRAIEAAIGPVLVDYAKRLARAAAGDAGELAGVGDAALHAMLEQANVLAIAWAKERSAELVTSIADVTRDGIRALVTDGIKEGFSNDRLADSIADAYVFSDARAMLISRTETTNAENAGTLEGWRASGVVEGKSWEPDAEACEICLGNADDGVIPLDDAFSSGDDAPTAHPNCECTLRAELVPESDVDG